MRGSNPIFNSQKFGARVHAVDESAVMTIQGTMNKTMVLLFLAFFAAAFTWEQYFSGNESPGLLMFGLFGGLIAAMATIFKPNWSPISAPIYAILEGLFLGGISAMYAHMYAGIVFQAVGLTFGVMFVMLFLYRSGTIKVTEKLRSGVIAATGAIALFYFASIILGFFGIGVPLLHSNGLFGVGFSLVIIGVAAFNLLLDFDFIENASREGMPKFMEWYAGFGLMITLVWLYLEMLRLLAKLQSRD
ncbi:MAG: hypothetical protein DWQ05_16500 [Calditrichaeota bacterium]|nr:MAG: hypothetical protein DWQ05_16500 [Calditrichota bacterium]